MNKSENVIQILGRIHRQNQNFQNEWNWEQFRNIV